MEPNQAIPNQITTTMKSEEHISQIMDMVLADVKRDHYLKLSLCIALYLTLIVIWLPGFSLGSRVYDVGGNPKQTQKRKVLKPPPEKPLEKVETREMKKKKKPMPDLTPDEPEPVLAPDPLPEPDLLLTDDWEIGIPDGPPIGDTIAQVGDTGVEPPVFTKRVQPRYPEEAVKVKLQGYVLLQAILRKDGTVDDIKILRGLGKGKFGFEEEATKALQEWEFLPGRVNGKPADVRMNLKIDFILH